MSLPKTKIRFKNFYEKVKFKGEDHPFFAFSSYKFQYIFILQCNKVTIKIIPFAGRWELKIPASHNETIELPCSLDSLVRKLRFAKKQALRKMRIEEVKECMR